MNPVNNLKLRLIWIKVSEMEVLVITFFLIYRIELEGLNKECSSTKIETMDVFRCRRPKWRQ